MRRFALTLDVGQGHELMDTVNHSYIQWCERSGIQPILIPNAFSDLSRYLADFEVEGILLTGGNDIAGLRPPPQESSEAPLRDKVEQTVLEIALERDLPILGICRGMQFLNVRLGGKLTHNLKESVPSCEGHVRRIHGIQIINDKVAAYLGTRSYDVNSFHNHGLTYEQISPVLDAFAVSPDGVVEGVIHKTKRILGLQWHPERQGSSISHDNSLIQGFLRGELWTAK